MTFISPKPRARKKDTKLMQLKKLRGVKKERAVRMGMLCRGVWGIWGHLLDVSRHFGTFWNPQKWLQSLARKTTNKKVRVQTKKSKGLGRGNKDVCGTGGLVGKGATSDI